MLKISIDLKSRLYVEKETQDIMIEFYLIKRNLIILLESKSWDLIPILVQI